MSDALEGKAFSHVDEWLTDELVEKIFAEFYKEATGGNHTENLLLILRVAVASGELVPRSRLEEVIGEPDVFRATYQILPAPDETREN